MPVLILAPMTHSGPAHVDCPFICVNVVPVDEHNFEITFTAGNTQNLLRPKNFAPDEGVAKSVPVVEVSATKLFNTLASGIFRLCVCASLYGWQRPPVPVSVSPGTVSAWSPEERSGTAGIYCASSERIRIPECAASVFGASQAVVTCIDENQFPKAIYEERGYRSRDIPQQILKHNLSGLDSLYQPS